MSASLLQDRVLDTLQRVNRTECSRVHVVMLPDFFVDHFVSLQSVEHTCSAVKHIAVQGGGNLPGFPQRITQGGNAANTALALARLGMSSHLICRTDAIGMHFLQYFLGKNNVDLSGVKTDGTLAITTALEFKQDQANVMVGDPGSVADFNGDLLNDYDHELISSADLVGVTNWNLNRFGTSLASYVFTLAKKQNVRTFFDSGDPSPRTQDIPELLSKVVTNPQLDIFGLNENELRYYTNSKATTQQDLVTAAETLKKKTTARLDLHTSQFACSLGTPPTIVPTSPLATMYRVTGAGDAWNAANLFADLLGFAVDERLFFANIFAGMYISSPQPIHPTIDMVINSIKKSR
jgi:sugar/nucleoside kinase (ribokinase family)